MNYLWDLTRLKTEAIPQIPSTCNTALMREFMVSEFNRDACDMDKPSRSPMASVEYRPKREYPTLDMDIADGQLVLPWREIYGLDYTQIVSLPYDEWRELSARLVGHIEKRGPTAAEMQIKFLSEIAQGVTTLSMNILNVFRSMVPGGKKPNVPVDTPPPRRPPSSEHPSG